MGFEIDWTEPALDDLAELVRYITQEDPEAAVRVGDEIVDHVGILASFPEIGPAYRRGATLQIRQITCRSCRIFYRVHSKSKRVEILHVWHGARQEPGDIVSQGE